MKKIQFYLANELVLRRETAESISNTTPGGTITQVKGYFIEEIRIPKGTPGVVIDTENQDDEKTLYVSFVSGDKKNTIPFRYGCHDGRENPVITYCFGNETYNYDGKRWKTNGSHKIYLTVKESEIVKVNKKQKTLTGWRVGDVQEQVPPPEHKTPIEVPVEAPSVPAKESTPPVISPSPANP